MRSSSAWWARLYKFCSTQPARSLSLCNLLGVYRAETEMLDQSFSLKLREDLERFSDRARRGAVEPPDTQVDDIKRLYPSALDYPI